MSEARGGGSGSSLEGRILELRQAFDRSFALAPGGDAAPSDDYLGIRLEGEPYALLLSELSGLWGERPILPLPSSQPALLGVAGVRGNVVPVFDLAALLGYAGGAPPIWLALTAGRSPLALAFQSLDGFLRIPRVDHLAADSAAGRRHVTESVRFAGLVRQVVSLRSLFDAITSRAGPTGPSKEP